MSKVVCIGSSPAIVGLIDGLRAGQADVEITWIGLENDLPYQRSLFADHIAKKFAMAQLFCRPESYYRDQKVELLPQKKITRVNLARRKVHFEDKQHLDYDFLVLADAPGVSWPDIKGTNKTGVYTLRRLSDVKDIIKNLPFAESIFIQSDRLIGLQTAFALAQQGKEVTLSMSFHGVLSEALSLEVRQWFVPVMEKAGIHIVENNNIAEILGEGEAKAVRLRSGKIYASPMVIFADVGADLRLYLENNALQVSARILADPFFQTNIENVFAVDQACQQPEAVEVSSMDLEEQGKVVAAKIMGQGIPYAPKITEAYKQQCSSWIEGWAPVPQTADLSTEGLKQELPS